MVKLKPFHRYQRWRALGINPAKLQFTKRSLKRLKNKIKQKDEHTTNVQQNFGKKKIKSPNLFY